MGNLNLDDDFVPFLSFFHFFQKWEGRKYFSLIKKRFGFYHGCYHLGRNMPTLMAGMK